MRVILEMSHPGPWSRGSIDGIDSGFFREHRTIQLLDLGGGRRAVRMFSRLEYPFGGSSARWHVETSADPAAVAEAEAGILNDRIQYPRTPFRA